MVLLARTDADVRQRIGGLLLFVCVCRKSNRYYWRGLAINQEHADRPHAPSREITSNKSCSADASDRDGVNFLLGTHTWTWTHRHGPCELLGIDTQMGMD